MWVKIRMSSIMHKTITPSVDSPALRHASGELLSLALMDARNHTLYLMSQYELALGTKQFQVPFFPELNPPLWELGHIGWFQEWWIARNMQRHRGAGCDPFATRLASIEPQADSRTPQDTRSGSSTQHTRPAAIDIDGGGSLQTIY